MEGPASGCQAARASGVEIDHSSLPCTGVTASFESAPSLWFGAGGDAFGADTGAGAGALVPDPAPARGGGGRRTGTEVVLLVVAHNVHGSRPITLGGGTHGSHRGEWWFPCWEFGENGTSGSVLDRSGHRSRSCGLSPQPAGPSPTPDSELSRGR
jgi:hypothetical protein